ncbi:four helix bundle protein [Tenacibaculum sp. MEBiC06402]|uniref:four helix bundle protein n=1 Tax=unclassified Tenacibaculum TaxID=2635139 RepID=UPI003B9C1E5D
MERYKSFENLDGWKKAREFNKLIYLATNSSSFDNDFDLKRQLRRASVSISSNIAEGFERNTDKEFIHFLYVAKASAGEVRSQLYLSHDLNYLSNESFSDLKFKIIEVSKIISGLIKYLKK